MIELKLQISSFSALGLLAQALADIPGAVIASTDKPSFAQMQDTARASAAEGTAATGKGKPTKAATPTAVPAESPEPASAAAPAEAPKPTSPKREDVSAKVVELATRDQTKAVALLDKFGVKKARDLKEEDLAAALKGAEEALALLDMA